MSTRSPNSKSTPDEVIRTLSDLLVDVRLLREECLALRAEVRRVEASEDRMRRRLERGADSAEPVLEHLPDPALILEGRSPVYGNAAWRRMVGDHERGGPLRDPAECVVQTDRERYVALVDSGACGGGQSGRFGVWTHRGVRVVDLHVRRITGGGTSEHARVLLVLRDASDRLDADARWRVAQAGLAASPVPTALFDTSGMIMRVNSACARLLGRSAPSLEGLPWDGLLDPAEPGVRRMSRHVRAGRSWTGRLKVGRLSLPLRVDPVRDAAGRTVGAVAVVTASGARGRTGAEADRGGVGSGPGRPDAGASTVDLDPILRDVGRRLRRRGVGVRYGLEAHLPGFAGDSELVHTALWAVTRSVGHDGEVFFRTRYRAGTGDDARVILDLLMRGRARTLDLESVDDPSETSALVWLERLARRTEVDVRVVTGECATTLELSFRPCAH